MKNNWEKHSLSETKEHFLYLQFWLTGIIHKLSSSLLDCSGSTNTVSTCVKCAVGTALFMSWTQTMLLFTCKPQHNPTPAWAGQMELISSNTSSVDWSHLLHIYRNGALHGNRVGNVCPWDTEYRSQTAPHTVSFTNTVTYTTLLEFCCVWNCWNI